MSSWIALQRRADFRRGQSVMVLGAGGSAGRLAIEVARHLGAREVHAVGRGELADPGALAAAGAQVDVVLDYLWGEPTAAALRAIVPARHDDGQRLTWVEVGSVAGRDAAIPSAALRAVNLRIVGSGQGSVDLDDITDELRAMAHQVAAGSFGIRARAVPLAQVEQIWDRPTDGERIVLVP